MNRDAYDKIDALNFSRAKYLLRSGKHFQAACEDTEDDPTKYAVGTLVHSMILEGKDLRASFAIKPKGMSFATKDGKAWRDSQTLPILGQEDSETVPRLADAIAMHKQARLIIEGCKLREHVIVTTMYEVKCKSRLDMVGIDNEGRPGFAEVKTSIDARTEFFRNRCCSDPFHYDMQAEFYASLLGLDLGDESRPWSVWIVVENKPPFDVACYAPTDYMIESGIEKLRQALDRYKECLAADSWPGACSEAIEPIDAPAWRQAQLVNAL